MAQIEDVEVRETASKLVRLLRATIPAKEKEIYNNMTKYDFKDVQIAELLYELVRLADGNYDEIVRERTRL